jgi:hypothetical protein
MDRPEQMRSVEQMCSRVAMAIHTRFDELRYLSKISKLYYEQGYTQGSMFSLQAASSAHFAQLVGGLGGPNLKCTLPSWCAAWCAS